MAGCMVPNVSTKPGFHDTRRQAALSRGVMLRQNMRIRIISSVLRAESNRQENLAVVECPFPVPRFPVSMLWHERNHAHGGHRWLRDVIIELASDM